MCALPPSVEAVPAGVLALKKLAALDGDASAMKPQETAAAPPPPPRSLLARYVAFLERYKFGVLLFWALLMTLGYYGMSRVFPNLVLKIAAVPGDANDVAHAALAAAFPAVAATQTTAVLLSAPGGNITALAAAADAAAQLGALGARYTAAGLLSAGSGASFWSYDAAGLGAAPQAAALVSPDGASALVTFATADGYKVTKQFQAFVADLEALAARLTAASAGKLQAHATGFLVLMNEGNVTLLIDAAITDSITLFLAFNLLCVALRSLRLMALACAALAVSGGGAFALTWALSESVETPNFAVSVILSTLCVLSLDYALFLLSRLKQALAAGASMPAAVETMLRGAGHTVAVSGATLSACFLVLAIFPVSALRAPGIATTFAVVMSVLVSLSFTPAALLALPGFFAADCVDGGALRNWPRVAALEARAVVASDTFWGAVAWATCRYRWALTVGLLALLTAPFAYRLKHFETTMSYRNLVDKDSDTVDALYHMQDAFGAGTVYGPSLLGVAPAGGVALSVPFFASAAAAVRGSIAASAPGVLGAADVTGLAWPPTDATAVSAAVAATAACPATDAAACAAACPPAACALRLATAATLSADGGAMLLRLNPHVDPMEPEGIAWTRAVRDALRTANAADPARVTWHLVVEPMPDTVTWLYSRLGELVGITAAVIVAILVLAFRSPAIAIRAVATLAVMEVCVWGAATAIYVDGQLQPGGVLTTFTSDYGLFFMMPLLSFSLVTGLGLDYDIFLLDSIVEARADGWGASDAISLGVLRSGPVISFAGIIMSVAFGGYLFSPIPLLNQLGFFVVFAVLLDSFVVRPLLVPAAMHCLGEVNFWPARMPPPSRTGLVLRCGAAEVPAEAEEQHAPKGVEVALVATVV